MPDQQTPGSSPLKQIRTFQGDVADALNKQNESLISIQRSEQATKEAHRVFSAPKSPEDIAQSASNKKLIWLIIGSVVLMILGGSIGWYAYVGYVEKTALPTVEQIPNRLIASERLEIIDTSTLSREAFISKINAEKVRPLANGSVIQLQLQKQIATSTTLVDTREFLNLLESRVTGSLLRSLNPTFMFGLLGGTNSSTENPNRTDVFVLIKLDSFDNAFPGMLDWEKNMRDDILPIFTTPETFASTSAGTPFLDTTIQNKDARILQDLDGQTVLLYSFFDNNILIITNNEEGLSALINKLNTEKLSR